MAGMIADMAADKKNCSWLDKVANKEVAKLANMVASHGGWSIGPKTYSTRTLPADLRVF